MVFGISVVIFTVLILASAAYITYRLGIFTVDEVIIEGNNRVGTTEIMKRAGLRPGSSLIFFSEEKVEKQIKKNPWIRSVTVLKEYPDSVFINVQEEQVYCMVLSEDGIPTYLSETGKILGEGNFELGLDFPLLIGDGIKDSTLLSQALQILELSSKSIILSWDQVSEVHIDPMYGISVFTTDNRSIDFEQGDIARKWRKVERIIDHLRSLGLHESYINISYDKMGVVSFEVPAVDKGAGDG